MCVCVCVNVESSKLKYRHMNYNPYIKAVYLHCGFLMVGKLGLPVIAHCVVLTNVTMMYVNQDTLLIYTYTCIKPH